MDLVIVFVTILQEIIFHSIYQLVMLVIVWQLFPIVKHVQALLQQLVLTVLLAFILVPERPVVNPVEEHVLIAILIQHIALFVL